MKEIKNSAGKVIRRELDPKAPVVCLEEARKIDCCLKKKAFDGTAAYTGKMNCGKVVVASLQHYCGPTGLLGGSNKCSAGGKDLVGDVLKKKTGTDADLLAALEELYKAHPVSTTQNPDGRKERARKEMEYMKTCINKGSASSGSFTGGTQDCYKKVIMPYIEYCHSVLGEGRSDRDL